MPFAVDYMKELSEAVVSDPETLSANPNPTVDWSLQNRAANVLSRVSEQQRVCQFRYAPQPRLRATILQSMR